MQSTDSTAVRCPLSGNVHSSRMAPDPDANGMDLDRLDSSGQMMRRRVAAGVLEAVKGFGV